MEECGNMRNPNHVCRWCGCGMVDRIGYCSNDCEINDNIYKRKYRDSVWEKHDHSIASFMLDESFMQTGYIYIHGWQKKELKSA
jgi:ribosomal protein L32